MANGFYTQKITSGDKTEVGYSYNSYSSMTFTNTHTSAINMDLYVTYQLGTDITSTTVLAAETEVASSGSVTLTVDTVNATADVFKGERVYRADGTFVGVCSSVTNTTTLVFATGLLNAITNNEVLHVGTRYTMLNTTQLPLGVSLKLSPDDFTFDSNNYKLYIDSSNSSGLIDIITRY
tara:strand:+ start:468 stop:1004 length:537 start_codon:yes stop_codon:yes gene_type:complete